MRRSSRAPYIATYDEPEPVVAYPGPPSCGTSVPIAGPRPGRDEREADRDLPGARGRGVPVAADRAAQRPRDDLAGAEGERADLDVACRGGRGAGEREERAPRRSGAAATQATTSARARFRSRGACASAHHGVSRHGPVIACRYPAATDDGTIPGLLDEGHARPFAHLLIRLGISPDAVTLVGTLGVCAGALVFFPQGKLLTGVLVITAFVFSDLIDGHMARLTGRTASSARSSTPPSTGSATAPIFAGLALYFAGPGDSELYLVLSPGVPGHGSGDVLRAGPGRGARLPGQGRHRRARRPAGRDPRDDLLLARSSTCRS